MRFLRFTLLLVALLAGVAVFTSSCNIHRCISCENCNEEKIYKISKIKKDGKYYFIFAKRDDMFFRIVTREPDNTDSLKLYDKIKTGNSYCLNLDHYYNYAPLWNGVNLFVFEVHWTLKLDDGTKIEFGSDGETLDCYFTRNLRGLYYLPNDTSTVKERDFTKFFD